MMVMVIHDHEDESLLLVSVVVAGVVVGADPLALVLATLFENNSLLVMISFHGNIGYHNYSNN